LEEKVFFGFSPSASANYQEARDFLTVNIYRAELDPYLADLAVEAGAELQSSTLITDLIRDKQGHIKGVVDDQNQKYYGGIVLGADGVVSTVAQRSGLRGKWKQDDLTLMVTIDFEASREKIDQAFAGNALHYWFSSAFPVAYSFFHGAGVHVGLGHFVNAWDKNPKYYLDQFLETPALKQQLALVGGRPREYQAHLLTFVDNPINTYSPNGVLLVGDAAGFPCPLEAEGIYYAMLSGKLAVEVSELYLNTGDPQVLKSYETAWRNSPIGEEFELGLEIYKFLREIPFSMNAARELIPFINDLFYSLLNVAESHTYNLAHFAPAMRNYLQLFPMLLKYIAPAIAPLSERLIEEKLDDMLPESLKNIGLRQLESWRRVRKRFSQLFYKILAR
jgi:electron transfer flavoprotein-quinone oxidoreductase